MTFRINSLVVLYLKALLICPFFFGLPLICNTKEPNLRTIEIQVPKGIIKVRVLDTKEKRLFGRNLSNVLLAYNLIEAQYVKIGYKDIPFPTDAIWIDCNNKVTLVKTNILPDTTTLTSALVYYSPKPTPFILKLPHGDAQKFGIEEGVKLGLDFLDERQVEKNLIYKNTTVFAPKGKVQVEIADTDFQRELGLGGRKNLSSGSGMLFIFDTAGQQAISQKGMLFSIDVIWMNRDKVVTFIKSNFSEKTYSDTQAEVYFSSKPDTLYVLELPASAAKNLGIELGTKLSWELTSPNN